MTDPREAALRTQIVRVCRRLWERGLVAGADGNVSARLAPDRFLVTPAGFAKVDLTDDDIVVVDGDGRAVAGRHRASSELAVHIRAYARRPDVGAVVHAHPPSATAMAMTGQTLPARVHPEIIVLLGPVPLVPYATPGTPGVADRFEPFWDGHDAFLMANHGALTLGPELALAHQRMEALEHAARTVVAARALGNLRDLGPDEVRTLEQMRNVLKDSPRESAANDGSRRDQ